MLRSVILAASRSKRVEKLVESAPISRDVVRRFVAGPELVDVVQAAEQLNSTGLLSTIDFLGEDTLDATQAKNTRDAYLTLLDSLAEHGLTPAAEVSVKLTALGQAFDTGLARASIEDICEAAQRAGTTVTLDMENHTTTDATLEAFTELRKDFPTIGTVLQAHLQRTEGDCRALNKDGMRIRLCKGAYSEPAAVAYHSAREVDRSFVRCLNILLSGQGYPMFATHDPRLVSIAEERIDHYRRTSDTFEFQMLYGVRPAEQQRLADVGYAMRVYVPYGEQWYGYLMRRLAERPANVSFFLRALSSKG
ncbi:MAG: proline dehydrogenase [Corynebacteriales bacterium]|nr:proline dehydrogenase [Mycobacteriales bacterium]